MIDFQLLQFTILSMTSCVRALKLKSVILSVIGFLISSIIQPVSAQILSGTFDWTGVADNGENFFDPASGTASFTYDTVQNLGTLTNFYGSYTYFYVFDYATFNGVGSTLPNPSNLPSNIPTPITTFAKLTDFSTATTPNTGFGGGTVTSGDGWSLTGINGQNTGGIGGTSWSGTNGNELGPDVFTGTISNFQETDAAPEPSTWAMLLGGVGLLAYLHVRIKTRSIIIHNAFLFFPNATE